MEIITSFEKIEPFIPSNQEKDKDVVHLTQCFSVVVLTLQLEHIIRGRTDKTRN